MAKLTKRQMKEDKFVTSLLRSQKFFNEHKSQILLFAAGILVVAIVIVFLISNARQAQEDAARAYGVANMYVREFYNVFEQDFNQDGIPDGNLDSSLVSLRNAKEQFQSIIENYGGTQQAKLATFYLGAINFKLGDYLTASEHYQKFLDKYYVDEWFEAAAKKGLASCKESLRDFEAAGKLFLEVGRDYPDFALRIETLYKAVINLGRAGLNDMALEAFDLLEDSDASQSTKNDAKVFLYEKGIMDPGKLSS